MKKSISIVLMLFLTFFSSMSFSLDGEGKIEKIITCLNPNHTETWKDMLVFKLSDGNWFGMWADWSEKNSHIAPSIVLMAYSMKSNVKMRATYSTQEFCGVSAAMYWNNTGDYLELER